jgi:hypothetical protein
VANDRAEIFLNESFSFFLFLVFNLLQLAGEGIAVGACVKASRKLIAAAVEEEEGEEEGKAVAEIDGMLNAASPAIDDDANSKTEPGISPPWTATCTVDAGTE